MNRLKNLAQTDSKTSFHQLDTTPAASSTQSHNLTQSSAATLDPPVDAASDSAGCHALFGPLHYEPGYAYPLIVWLHADGGSERDLRRVMPKISLRNYVGTAPRGIVAPSANGTDDFDFDDRPHYTWRQNDAHLLLAEQRLFSCIEHAHEHFHVAPQRVFLIGHGDGGTMALRLALTYPDRFAGVISIAGPLPRDGSPLAQVREARQLPILLAAGQHGVAYSQHDVAADLRLLHTAGMSVSVRLYPSRDEATDLLLADLDRWMMEELFPGSAPAIVQECDLSS